jgi:hypothetical protein
MEQEEQFLPIPGWEGKYSVSNQGTVISHFSSEGKKLKHKITSNGYHYVSLSRPKEEGSPRIKSVGVARAIAMAFIPNPHDYPEVDFINNDKNDLRQENLQWVKHSFNVRKSQAYVYRVWHKDNPTEVFVFASRRQVIQKTKIWQNVLINYLFRTPGEYHKSGWAVECDKVKGYSWVMTAPGQEKMVSYKWQNLTDTDLDESND